MIHQAGRVFQISTLHNGFLLKYDYPGLDHPAQIMACGGDDLVYYLKGWLESLETDTLEVEDDGYVLSDEIKEKTKKTKKVTQAGH